jgi:pimeloyl-ACP methyl ester carboxylesterase
VPRTIRRRLAVCTLVAVGLLGAVSPTSLTTAAASAGAASASTTPLAWDRCRRSFECATLTVPVDYSDPSAGSLEIAVVRLPARDPQRRLGSLVVNYGGPGDPGTETLRIAAEDIPPAIRRRFDLVSFDPRGTGGSRPVDCVDDATFERAWSDDRTPNSDADLPSFYDGTASSVDLVAECVARNGPWLAHIGSRNVARDVDRLRAALGEDRLDFLGYSYGTVIGAVYAQEFPDRIRTMVLDSAVDLSSSMAVQQQENAAGFERALAEFLDDCADRDDCAFAPGGDPRQALDELRTRFEAGTRLEGTDGRMVGVSEFYVALLAALYSRSEWPYLAEALELAAQNDGSGLQILNDAYAGRRGNGTYSNYQEVLGVILCDDQPEPLVSFDEYRAAYKTFARDYPFFGPVLGGSPLGCDPRLPAPQPDDVVGDVRTTDAPPVLVIGTTHDPATPYSGAQDLRARLGKARLLTVEDTRHGGYAIGNACVDRIVNRYLVSTRLPRAGARCAGT